MGFRVKSVEDALKFVLGPANRSRVGDGFPLSLILVTDDSDWSRALLRDHFVQLCQRTGDRARIIYFSSMNTSDADNLFRRTWQRKSGATKELFRRLLSRPGMATLGELNPSFLEPVTEADIKRFRRDLHSFADHAVFGGASASWRFAQAFGLGARVPFVLVHASLPDAATYLIAGQQRTPEEMFARLCTLVDDYYALNSAAFAKWRAIESDISAAGQGLRRELQSFQKWSQSNQIKWDKLEFATELKFALDTARGPAQIRTARCSALLESKMAHWRGAVSAADSADRKRTVVDELVKLVRDDSRWSFPVATERARSIWKLDPSDDPIFKDATYQLRRVVTGYEERAIALDPTSSLAKWQLVMAANAVSKKRWRRRMSAPVVVLFEALAGVPVGGGADYAHRRLLEDLQRRLKADVPDDMADYLRGHLAHLWLHRPSWLDGERFSLGDVVKCETEYAAAPISSELGRRMRELADSRAVEQLETELNQDVAPLRHAIVELVHAAAESMDVERLRNVAEVARIDLAGACCLVADELRAELETDMETRTRLPQLDLKALRINVERQMAVVGRIEHAWAHETDIIPVQTSALVAMSGRAATETRATPATTIERQLRSLDEKAISPTIETAWQGVKRDSPSTRLLGALVNTLGESRLEKIVGGDLGLTMSQAVGEIAENGAHDLLGRLSAREREDVLRTLGGHPNNAQNTTSAIIAASGARPRPRLFGQQAFGGLIDSITDLDPIDAGPRLRRGLERYLKQFVIVWQPILDQQLTSYLSATLGPLCDTVTRILRTRKLPQALALDSRWQAAHKVLEGLQRGGESGAVASRLAELPSLVNPLCHDHLSIVDGAAEMLDSDRLKRLIWVSRDVQTRLADAYPICLLFRAAEVGEHTNTRLVFASDPGAVPAQTVECAAWPPAIPGLDIERPLMWLQESYLLMLRHADARIRPIIQPLVGR